MRRYPPWNYVPCYGTVKISHFCFAIWCDISSRRRSGKFTIVRYPGFRWRFKGVEELGAKKRAHVITRQWRWSILAICSPFNSEQTKCLLRHVFITPLFSQVWEPKVNTWISANKRNENTRRKTNVNLMNKLQHYFPAGAPTQILQPNALWTAGCCVYRYTSSRTGITSTRAESIAVMGNNDMRSHCTLTRALDLATLETLIVAPGAIPADIFPGNHDCARNSGSHYL